MGAFIKTAAGRKPGDIFAVATPTPPAGALPLMGGLYPIAAHQKLFDAIGAQYDEAIHSTFPDFFRVPGRTPYVQQGSRAGSRPQSLDTYEPGTAGTVSATLSDYFGFMDTLTVSVTDEEDTYFHASLTDAEIKPDVKKLAVPFVLQVPASPDGQDDYALRIGVTKRDAGLSVSGAAVVSGASYVRCVVHAGLSAVSVSGWQYCTNGEGGFAYTATALDDSLDVSAPGVAVIVLALLIDRELNTVGLLTQDGTIHNLGDFDKATRTLFPYIGFEKIDGGSAIGFVVAMQCNSILQAPYLPGLGVNIGMPLPKGYLNAWEQDYFNVGFVEYSGAKFPGVWWADALPEATTNETVLWCIQAK